jgi:hypothetical protein
LVPERSCAVDRKLTTGGRFYECHQYLHRSAYRGVHDCAPPLDAQAKTPSRGVWISKDVPILRIDHVSIKGMLPGVWPALYDGGVLDFKEMNQRMVQISHELRGFSG